MRTEEAHQVSRGRVADRMQVRLGREQTGECRADCVYRNGLVSRSRTTNAVPPRRPRSKGHDSTLPPPGPRLGKVQVRVASVAREQGLVAPLVDDAAALEHDDPVGVADRGEPVRDDERRAPAASAG